MIRIYPSTIKGTLQAPPSRAHAQRLLFASALTVSSTLIKNIPYCEDINTTLDALGSFGCRISTNKSGDVIIDPFAKTVPIPYADLDFKRSGLTSKFALAVAAAQGIRVDAKADQDLAQRQLVPLTSRMAIRGITFSSFSFPLSMHGRLLGGEYKYRGDEGDQFISAMLMALPMLRDPSTVVLESPLVDSSYIDLTIDTLKKSKINIERTEDGFYIPGMQQYESPGTVTAENDWALASMWVCAGAASEHNGGKVKVTGLPKDSPQLYRNTTELRSLISQDFRSLTFDASEFPELATLVCGMSLAKGGSANIDGVPQLRFAETNRLKTIADMVRYGRRGRSYGYRHQVQSLRIS